MLILAILLWICITLSAPAWCYWFLGIAALFRIISTTIDFIK